MSQTTTVTTKKVTPRRHTKPAAAPATTQKKTVLSKVAHAVVKFFVFVEGARPVSGPRLYAHTDAAMRFLGLATQQSVSKAAAVAVLGSRAIKYHLERGNMEERGGMIHLTKQGYAFFKDRAESGKVDGSLSSAFLSALSKGKTSTAAGIKENHLIPVGMSLR